MDSNELWDTLSSEYCFEMIHLPTIWKCMNAHLSVKSCKWGYSDGPQVFIIHFLLETLHIRCMLSFMSVERVVERIHIFACSTDLLYTKKAMILFKLLLV